MYFKISIDFFFERAGEEFVAFVEFSHAGGTESSHIERDFAGCGNVGRGV